MIVRSATLSDLHYVLSRLSRQSQADLASLGVDSTQAFDLASGWFRGATTHWFREAPAAVFGFVDVTAPVKVTWFLATQPFFDAGFASIRHARRWMAEHFVPETVISISRNPTAAKWFRAIGFDIQSEADGQIVYVYKG